MSVKAIGWVWHNSRQKGGALLLELAIADFADDDGKAWPAIETLAAKARMTTRNANYVIEKKLKPAGLVIKHNAGPHRTNLFQLPINGGEKISPLKDFQDETHFPETLKPISPNPSYNRHNKRVAESDKLIPDSLNSPKDPQDPNPSHSKKRKQSRAGIPPELQPTVSKVVARINELGGTRYRDDRREALRNLIARLNEGRTETECLAVVEGRHAAWADNKEMQEYFRPSTLFAESHFEDYLQAAHRLNGNGYAKPEIKDLGNGMVEVDGRQMDRHTYERRYQQATS